MTTFFENSFYYPTEVKREYNQPSNNNDFNDFFIDDLLSPLPTLNRDNSSWEYAVTQLRHQIFNSTSVAYPAPETYLIKQAKRENNNASADALLSMMNSSNSIFRFHPDRLWSTDTLEYRRHRSENLLVRMIHCRNLDMSQLSLMRLSKGIFVHQKWQSSSPQSSPTLSVIEDCLANEYLDTTVEAPVDTFHFNNVHNMGNHLTSSCYDMFVPYSYTFGARYTNPYGSNDLVIRGKIPLWCQTLFLSVCLKRTEPIQMNVPQQGLFPFAPLVSVTFKSLNEYGPYNISPDLTILYEKFTLEHIDPFEISETPKDEHCCLWPAKRQEILKNVLVCDLSDDLSKVLSDMATVWAASQGLLI
ncbi:hypothetical protein BDF21DRAFT_494331 [Thamnidium elegans]|uniref:Uncharacterized protein n=1 Tax=Thamnidium elegans TaxID=101142 RepID=A0A8H7SSX4_9FUNG|nr:hypothetical protein INT48_009165 [Thamnidium elegans]KAI8077423.1 hypothetical protein BDF21DRAFT_494331 [Thamnidium elegans]